MPVGVVITSEHEAASMFHWAWHFARNDDNTVAVINPQETATEQNNNDEVVILDLSVTAEESDTPETPIAHTLRHTLAAISDNAPTVALHTLPTAEPARVLKQLGEIQADIVILPRHEKTAQTEREDENLYELFRHASCDMLLIRPGSGDGQSCQRILVPTAGGPHSGIALQWAAKIADANEGHVDALYVEPPIGAYAQLVGQQIVQRHINKAVGASAASGGRVHPMVVLAGNFRDGIAKTVEAGEYDLVLIGASNQWSMRKILFSAVPDNLLAKGEGTTIAVMRKSIPMTTRFRRGMHRLVENIVPQLERSDRVTLVERVQSNSQWDFDFIALVCLSTSIAALGLIRNSAAVVIGAMLVAPLMTPLVGGGLALVQGNVVLIRNAIRSVCFGFVLAFVIGYLLGMTVPGLVVTSEMLSRGSPNVLDLVVAFISGIAAAYATARPNLSAALPGVAIAASLVPPIATSGIALAAGQPVLSAGSALLFFTNIVAILMGASFSLFAVGVHGDHSHGREKRWVKSTTLILMTMMLLLAVPLSYVLYASLEEKQVPPQLVDDLRSRVEVEGASLVSIESALNDQGVTQFIVTITASAPAPPSLVEAMAEIAGKHHDGHAKVRIVTKLVSEATAN